MALPLRALRLPSACPSCVRTTGIAFHQVRGKRTVAKATGITVRLLQDIPTFGRAGSILNVAKGRMRNIWYPRNWAEYILPADLKKIPDAEKNRERDREFKSSVPVELEKKKVEVKLLTLQDSYETLSAVLPPTFTFSAKAILPGHTQIHGSITSTQVAAAMRSILNAQEKSELAKRVVINERNIQVYGSADDPTKIKDLGEFSFSYHMDESHVIRRKITVIEQDASPV